MKIDVAPAGPDQLFVTYESSDDGSDVKLGRFMAEVVGPDAARRDAEDWEVVSVGVASLRQLGTGANVFFQAGGQFATKLGVVVAYRRR